jgi:GTPase SAR1 family protein
MATTTEFKIVLVGPAESGKTSYLHQLLECPFKEIYTPTLGVDVHSVVHTFNGVKYRLNVWDVAGQPQYKGLVGGYYTQADGVLAFYDPRDKNCADVGKDLDSVYQVTGPISTVVVKTKGYDTGVETPDICEIDTKTEWNVTKPIDLLLAKLTA